MVECFVANENVIGSNPISCSKHWRYMSIIADGLIKLNEEQEKVIEFIESTYFPWYYQPTVTKYSFHGHTLMNRNGDQLPETGIISSPYYEPMISIFKDFCLSKDIQYKTIFRAAINSTSYHDLEMAEIHIDHRFEHKNFIFYINQVSQGSTFIYNQDETTLEDVIAPEKNKGVIWDGRPHAQGWCGLDERRLVLIVTFI